MSEYQEKFEVVRPWLASVLEVVKKDLKNEHLKKDRSFCKKYFLGKNYNAVSVEEMVPAYQKEIAEGNVGLGEFIASRWLFKNSDVYDYFEKELSSINPDFEKIESLTLEQSEKMIGESKKQFGATRTYLFAVLNSVTFPEQLFEELRSEALNETREESSEKEALELERSLEAMQKRHEREISSLSNKFEKKLSGMEKKYLKDTETLKKQVSTLSKKLTEHG